MLHLIIILQILPFVLNLIPIFYKNFGKLDRVHLFPLFLLNHLFLLVQKRVQISISSF